MLAALFVVSCCVCLSPALFLDRQLLCGSSAALFVREVLRLFVSCSVVRQFLLVPSASLLVPSAALFVRQLLRWFVSCSVCWSDALLIRE